MTSIKVRSASGCVSRDCVLIASSSCKQCTTIVRTSQWNTLPSKQSTIPHDVDRLYYLYALHHFPTLHSFCILKMGKHQICVRQRMRRRVMPLMFVLLHLSREQQ